MAIGFRLLRLLLPKRQLVILKGIVVIQIAAGDADGVTSSAMMI